MRCKVVRKWLWAYLEGSAPARHRIEAHLASCRACAQELSALRALDRAVTLAVLDVPSPDLTGTIMARVSAEPVRWSRPVMASRWTRLATATGGMVALAGGALVLSFLARLWVWALASAGLIALPPVLVPWLTQVPVGWLIWWPALEATLHGVYVLVSGVPAPVLLAGGLLLVFLQTWATARFLEYRDGAWVTGDS